MMRHEPQGLARWANTDPSLHCNVLPPVHRGLTWRSVYIYLLKVRDYDAAELMRRLNEREDGDGGQ
jgi:hypothetical protein